MTIRRGIHFIRRLWVKSGNADTFCASNTLELNTSTHSFKKGKIQNIWFKIHFTPKKTKNCTFLTHPPALLLAPQVIEEVWSEAHVWNYWISFIFLTEILFIFLTEICTLHISNINCLHVSDRNSLHISDRNSPHISGRNSTRISRKVCVLWSHGGRVWLKA